MNLANQHNLVQFPERGNKKNFFDLIKILEESKKTRD